MTTDALLELVPGLVGFLLTLMIFSYVIKDNALFRIATHILIGVAAGYATVLVLYNILWYRMALPLRDNPTQNLVLLAPPFIFGVWLLLKVSPRMSKLATPVLAFMVGIAAASAIGGAVLGTIFPQANAAINTLAMPASGSASLAWALNGIVVLIGTAVTFASFHFTPLMRSGRASIQPAWIVWTARIGQGFIAVALGVLFAGVYAAAIAAFVERSSAIWNFFWAIADLVMPK